MKKILGFSVLLFFLAFKTWTGVFDFSITTPEGDDQPLSMYQGKKIMIVVLPVTHTAGDSNLLKLLDTLSISYADSVTMIGIPSYEDGFADDSLGSLLPWYRYFLGEQFIISGGMSTRKNSAYQTPLFSYLTDADQNGYFNDDVYGAGEKFFIDTSGNLYGISTPDADFNTDLFSSMLNRSEEQ
jgi:glutathione peroxidase-family protein